MTDIWNDPVETETEGVSADPPAAPSEVVQPEKPEAVDDASEGAEQVIEEEAPAPELPDTPDVKREARRVFMEAQKLGGFETLKEAYDLQSTIQNPEVSAEAKLQALYTAAPRAFDDLKKELFFKYWDNPAQQDTLVQEKFGASAAEIAEALAARGQVAPSPKPTTRIPSEDELAQMTNAEVQEKFREIQASGFIPEIVKEKLTRLEQLEKEFPQLKQQVSSIESQRQAIEQQEIQKLGAEFVQEVMSPVVRMMEEAGLKVLPQDTPEERAWKEEVWNSIYFRTYDDLVNSDTNRALAADIQTFIERKDRTAAWSRLRTVQARAEMAAAKRIPLFTSQRQKQREAQAQILAKDRPPQVAGGQTSLGSQQPQLSGRNVWDDPTEQDKWRDIQAGVA
jgi:hypothetical protein